LEVGIVEEILAVEALAILVEMMAEITVVEVLAVSELALYICRKRMR
jgi:hypothetical protein